MFDKQQRKLKRSAKLISVLSKYGFQDLLIRMNLSGNIMKSDSEKSSQLDIYERLKLALEELGPTFVKLGQSFSNREDLLPPEFIVQLQKLQDHVETVDLDVKSILETELSINIDDYFQYIQTEPIAAASIAQVYKAVLKDGTAVIIKIKRPDIDSVIQDDLMLLKDIVKLIDTYSEIGDQMNLKHAVFAFEKSLLEELSLINEKNNIQQFAYNFRSNKDTYVPKVFDDLCTNNILTMEFIDGIKVTNIEELKANNISPITISEVGYRLFVSQILDYGFFHADPHGGNILITKQGKVVFIDFGAVGKIQPNDKEILENLIINFLAKNPRKIIRNLKKMSIFYDIPDEKKFENNVTEILNYIHSASLKEIDIAEILNKMKDVLKENRLVMPDYFYLLFKGISLMEGVGRSINPDLDIVKSLKPYTKKIFFKKINPENLAKDSFDKMSSFVDSVGQIPDELRTILGQLNENKFSVNTEIKNFDKIDQLIKSSIINLILTMLLASNIIATAIIWSSQTEIISSNIVLISVLLLAFSLLIALVLLVRLLRR